MVQKTPFHQLINREIDSQRDFGSTIFYIIDMFKISRVFRASRGHGHTASPLRAYKKHGTMASCQLAASNISTLKTRCELTVLLESHTTVVHCSI